jgi:hypothetical protein
MANYNRYCPFPEWAIYITTSDQIPTAVRPNTYRVPFGKGRCLVCVNDQVEALKKVETEFGSAALAQQSISQGDEGSVNVTTWTSNYQPSITVYMWKRVKSKEDVQRFNWFNIEETPENVMQIYWDNAIIDYRTMKPKQPDPYNP